MSIKTAIQWCDSTVNPTMGCDGCELWLPGVKRCYAGKLHSRFGGHTVGYAPTFEEVTEFPGRMASAADWRDLSGTCRVGKPWLDGRQRHIFISDMSDALSDAVSFEFLRDEIISAVVGAGKRHRWLWLTKRPQRMADFSRWLADQDTPWPTNLWAGTSVTTSATLSRIDALAEVGDASTSRFLSLEPQWEPIRLAARLRHLRWVIQGGESGSIDHPFHIEWAMSLQHECKQGGVPYFLKQLGACAMLAGQRLRLENRHGGEEAEWPAELRIRQVPEAAERTGKDKGLPRRRA